MTRVLADLRRVSRRFGSVTALAGADLEIRSGEVHGVLGENGAGKTTLLGVLGGMVRPDAGTVEVGGESVSLSSPRDARARGIGLVHQHFTLVPRLSVLENLALGGRGASGGLTLRLAAVRSDATALMRRTALEVDLDARVEDLGVGDRQRVEILKALLREPPILALDEPTAVLTPPETDALFELLRELAEDGCGVVIVAHKIDEVLAVADRVTVLRDGRTVLSSERQRVESRQLIRAMVGREVDDRAAVGLAGRGRGDASRKGGEPVAALEGVRAVGATGTVTVREVSLTVRRGELVGIAGVEGNGQRELARLLAGRQAPAAGSARLPAGVGFVPQDRTREGVIGDFDLVQNVALALYADERFGRGVLIDWAAIREQAEVVRERFGIRAPSVETAARALSGGNQQRLVVGRELAVATDLLVAENPTRGLDVAATAFVHDELRRLTERASGPGVVLISTDLEEVLELADRVLVMVRGRLVPVPDDRRTREGIGALMLGGAGEAA